MNYSFKVDDGKDRHYGLDLIRVIAIVSVMLYHFPREENNLILRAISHYGYLGVDIFFILSGFLIGGQTFARLSAGKPFDLKSFCIRRFYRTLPNYYFILAIYIVLEGFDKFNWKFFFFLQNIGGLYAFTHSWSLCIEEHFYIMFPICILIMTKINKIKLYPALIFGIVIGTIAVRYLIWTDVRPDLIYYKDYSDGFELFFNNIFYPTYSRLDGIAIGTFLAFLKYFKPATWQSLLKRSDLFLFLSIIIFVGISAVSWKRVEFTASVFGFSAYAISFACLLISVIPQNSLLTKFKLPFIKQISILSYALYLTHTFAIGWSVHISDLMGFLPGTWPTWLMIFPLSLAVAYLLYAGLEKPTLLLRDRKIQAIDAKH